MNINELADLLDQASEVIKKQQIEIEALKAKLKREFNYVENLLKAQEK
jgi:glycine cleavage system regulatory protein